LRLEALLDAGAPASAGGSASATGDLDPATLDRLAVLADRLRRLTTAIDERTRAGDWDAVDQMAARLLLDQLTTAARDCRTVAAAATARLAQAEAAVTDIQRELDRERQRADGVRA
jgi:cell division protein ZapA (FtsZ GTPase activity inhibitor)